MTILVLSYLPHCVTTFSILTAHGIIIIIVYLIESTSSSLQPSNNGNHVPVDRTKQQRIVIIGAGPTGLGAAHRLYNMGILNSNTQVIVLERENHPGGLASSVRDRNGFLWDNGGHVVFSHYKYFDHALDNAVPDWNKLKRAAFTFMKGSDGIRRFIPYPVQANIHAMYKGDRQNCLNGLKDVANGGKQDKPANFDEWLLQNFGIGLCEIFMRKYNRKVWTVDPSEMNAVWVGERVAVPDIASIEAKIAEYDSTNGTVAIDSEWGPNRLFRFPHRNGTGGIWKAVAHKLPQGWFHYKQNVVEVNMADKKLLVSDSDDSTKKYPLTYDYLISTIPLDALLQVDKTFVHTNKSITECLVYSHTHVIGVGLRGKPPKFLADKSWMYFPDSDSPFYRATVFSSYSDDHVPFPGKYWSLMCEASEPMNSQYPDHWTEDYLLKTTVATLVIYGFIVEKQVVSRYHHRLEHGYPVPSLRREDLLKTAQPWLESHAVYSRGRFGGWRYEVGNQDHSFMQGVEVAELIMMAIPEETYSDPGKINSMASVNRSLHSPLQTLGPDYEIVISHYVEDLSWLEPHANHCHVYHKGSEIQPRFKYHQWEKLPNVGRESHTHLHHIITNYDHLADVTVFLQGSIKNHVLDKKCFGNPMDYVNLVRRTNKLVVRRKFRWSQWGRIFQHSPNNLYHTRRASVTLAELWSTLFNSTHPAYINISHCACFSVPRALILKRPKAFYKKVIAFVNDHPNPEEGHYIERLWYTFFTP